MDSPRAAGPRAGGDCTGVQGGEEQICTFREEPPRRGLCSPVRTTCTQSWAAASAVSRDAAWRWAVWSSAAPPESLPPPASCSGNHPVAQADSSAAANPGPPMLTSVRLGTAASCVLRTRQRLEAPPRVVSLPKVQRGGGVAHPRPRLAAPPRCADMKAENEAARSVARAACSIPRGVLGVGSRGLHCPRISATSSS